MLRSCGCEVYDSSSLLRFDLVRGGEHHRAADQRKDLPPPHSITSSARARSVGGIVRPKAAAVFRLIRNSNLVGCSTGKSAGFAPRMILSTNPAPRTFRSSILAP